MKKTMTEVWCFLWMWGTFWDPDEEELWISKRPHRFFMMHIKQRRSGDLCFSPTYSLLCSVSIPVEAAASHTVLQERKQVSYVEKRSRHPPRKRWRHTLILAAALRQLQAPYPAMEDDHLLSTHMQHFGPAWVHEPVQKIAFHHRRKNK